MLCRIFFSPPHFSAGFFFPQKRVTCLHIQNVLTFIAGFLKTGSTRVLSFLRMFSKGHNIEAMHYKSATCSVGMPALPPLGLDIDGCVTKTSQKYYI